MTAFARALAAFLSKLQQIDADGGPLPGEHNFFRGAPLTIYDHETRWALKQLAGRSDVAAAAAVWERALSADWTGAPVWFLGMSPRATSWSERGV